MLAFTPPSLAFLGDAAPTFMLRAATGREKRYLRRLFARHGLRNHSRQDLRDEMLKGLEALWSPEAFQQNSEMLTSYWKAVDDFGLQKAEDPDIEFRYDKDLEAACEALPGKIAKFWPPLGDMLADNADLGELNDTFHTAVIVANWKNFDLRRVIDEGYDYLTIACADALLEKLEKLSEVHSEIRALPPKTLSGELILECWRRMSLDEEEAKNSASPSQSEMTPVLSTTTAKPRAKAGKSPASKARSSRTRSAG